jgi:hypothetical protein
MRVGPKLQLDQLTKKQAVMLADGRERHGPLPGVISDAKAAVTSDPAKFIHCDRAGYGKNRELAERISDAFEELKTSDEHGPHFILAWRLYPNKDHPRWSDDAPHACGCSCGSLAPLPGRKKKKKKKTAKKAKAKKSARTTGRKKSKRKSKGY